MLCAFFLPDGLTLSIRPGHLSLEVVAVLLERFLVSRLFRSSKVVGLNKPKGHVLRRSKSFTLIRCMRAICTARIWPGRNTPPAMV
jgi:hypothetical protein